ncbi:ectonucleoside triphosphate diphosphohydrolase 8 isoform X3 [Macaca thibetana thibetana]|uniref:ectonucleoside triphosphate diphosphohydrolase 8 isoform X3 n=1 Tax=Macaca mulatta TaxID=9544 RepID=UPI0010A265F9|nr:ectonucleoside triphosphate diphosphohydrolase 8 isoform X3 [Macaca mulatta]XP_050616053.1 ectonucleoside triphosphate diphosphohydrolase 8 isoform X3 [Macaca thibetana thibetana]
MGLSRKEQVFLAILGASGVSGLTALILLLVEATSVLLPTDIKFGIVFDAGSSHTSLFLYQWPADKENGTGVVSQALACQVEGPGISSYTSDPAQAGESLRGCLEEALVLIPEAQHRKTPMFLGATAGMRLLRQKNSSQARDIFAAVTQVLGRSPVDFWGAELLAGQDEGAFGWITVNYGLGTLVKYSFTGEWIQPPEETLVGALDMGGASTQITFVPGGPILDKSTQADFRLYGSNYSVYTHSYLCFGRDQMLSRLLVGLVQAFSNFYYTFHFLNLTSGQPLSTVNATIWEFCQRPWKLVEASYPGQDRWLRDYCASGLYILTLLHEGYRFSEETWPSLEFRKQAGGVDIGWTLGYMLNLTGMIPADAPAQLWAVSYGVWVAKVVFMVLTLVAVVGAALVQLFWLQD